MALGPATNVALAILLDPSLKDHVKEIIFMGGAVRVPGNCELAASFNARFDPEAAHIVYNAGIPIVQIGLDICDQFNITLDDLADIRDAGTAVSNLFTQMVQFRIDQIPSLTGSDWYRVRGDGIPLNDLAAAAYLMNPDWFGAERFAVDIVTDGIAAGQTVVDFREKWNREPNALFAYEVDSRAAIDDWKNCLIRY